MTVDIFCWKIIFRQSHPPGNSGADCSVRSGNFCSLAVWKNKLPGLRRDRQQSCSADFGNHAGWTFLIVNGIFKTFWGRARPRDIDLFGGSKAFSLPLEISNQCAWDCSFMSGHTAVAFWLLAPALLAPKSFALSRLRLCCFLA